MTRSRLLILGATGLLGSELVRQFSDDFLVNPIGHRDLDITQLTEVHDLVAAERPDWVINAAAYSDVDGCETDSDKARLVNTDGAINVARACAMAQARLLFFSSDYVFEGNAKAPYVEKSQPNPINIYGRTKLDAEQGIQGVLPEALIVRTAWLYGTSGRDFVKAIASKGWELLQSGKNEAIRVVNDQIGSPTNAGELVAQLKVLLDGRSQGIYHCSGHGQTSWFEYARLVIEELGIDAEVRPCSSSELNRPARRPAYSVLENAKLKREGLDRMGDYKASLMRYLEENREVLINEV